MNIGERIHLLRNQRKFTQNKLGEMPGITIDYLVRENAENLVITKISDHELLKMFERVDQMDTEDKIIIKGVIESFVLKYKYKELSRTA
jgi:transcriptional regulator with XRE-family HTH domain